MPYIHSVRELTYAIRQGRFTSVGGYPLFFLTADGGTLDPRTVKAELSQISRATRDYHKDRSGDAQWAVVAYDVNWEDASMYDDHTGERIESAYAEDEAEDHLEGNNPKTKRRKRRAAKKPARKARKKAPRKKVSKKRSKKAAKPESSAETKLKARMRSLIGKA